MSTKTTSRGRKTKPQPKIVDNNNENEKQNPLVNSGKTETTKTKNATKDIESKTSDHQAQVCNGESSPNPIETPRTVRTESPQIKMITSETDIGFLKSSPYKASKNKVKDEEVTEKSDFKKPKPAKRGSTQGKRGKSSKSVKASPVKSHAITEFYPIRRSSRKTKSLIKKELADEIINAVQSKYEGDLEIVEFKDKGRGVVGKRSFTRGEYVVEYAGDLISWHEAKSRESEYALDTTVGCYMYYFNARNTNYCIDATAESGRLGRLLNHSRRSPNCLTRLVWVPTLHNSKKELPHLVIVAKRDIDQGEELTYDYGDRDKSAVEVHPWLKS
ncbi:histone-lysine N-methyltransferase set-1 [Ciona intestinalis]